MRKTFLLAALLTATPSFASTALDDLNAFGKSIAGSTENGAVRFEKAEQTTKTPMNAYKLTFSTNHEALMSLPNAAADKTAYFTNRAKTEVWQQKFCNSSLRPIFQNYRINAVFGALTDQKGELQSLAICMESKLPNN